MSFALVFDKRSQL